MIETQLARAYTFDDVSLVPKFSSLDSRDESELRTFFGIDVLDIPVVSSPMDSVTELDMAMFMNYYGGIGMIHRYLSIDKQVEIAKSFVKESGSHVVGAAVGINGDAWERVNRLVDEGVYCIMLDVAHGHTQSALDALERIKNNFPNICLISANICTESAASQCINAGVDILRVGVGGGSACSTRMVAGVGVPQLTAIMDCYRAARGNDVQIIADGGVKNSGHAVKALAAGADAVMLGGFLAPFPVSSAKIMLVNTGMESGLEKVIHGWKNMDKQDASRIFSEPADFDFGPQIVKKKVFRGMASDEALSEYKKDERYTVEGEQFLIDIDNDFENTFTNFLDGIKLGLSYLGCRTIQELHDKAQFVEITNNGFIEATPHKGGE